ncbi:aquaporin Z [Cupriavidus numazuensis]|uniref:Aquaporin Z 2 n=1 Tax=Cupriavidus numazuensis TaxID=221992 RepID=A0ABN7QAU8_9BURK|nr:aquaporin Z [Cupriavidus numazuensis]CAG2156850.1 Aquaporin Z 2 [Cupriavidus numazuensis]
MSFPKKLFAEGFGTFWLTFGGCGAAILAASVPDGAGIGLTGVSLAFGLTVLTMAYAVGPVSGAHLNPAVTIGMATAGRFSWSQVFPYIAAQVVGAIGAAWLLSVIATGSPDFDPAHSTFAANGFAEHSPRGYSLLACFVCETVMTFFFVAIVLGATSKREGARTAPLAIGLALTLIHLVSIPVTNTSVNPARSTGPALLMQGWAIDQLWMFWAAPILGAVIAGLLMPWLLRGHADAGAIV